MPDDVRNVLDMFAATGPSKEAMRDFRHALVQALLDAILLEAITADHGNTLAIDTLIAAVQNYEPPREEARDA